MFGLRIKAKDKDKDKKQKQKQRKEKGEHRRQSNHLSQLLVLRSFSHEIKTSLNGMR